MSYFRIHSTASDVNELLDPKNHVSTPWSLRLYTCPDCDGPSADCDFCGGDGEVEYRRGISVCRDVEDLLEYFARVGSDLSNVVLVERDGPRSVDTPDDEHLGENLIHPTEILSVRPLTEDEELAVLDRVDEIYA